MEWSKIKNIVLLILLTVNIILVILVIYRQHQSTAQQDAAVENMVNVLQNNGIEFDPSCLPEPQEFSAFSVERDVALEQEMAESLLGQVEKTDLGGGVSSYINTSGSATFRSNGEFEIMFLEAGPAAEGDLESRAKALLQQMEFETNWETAVWTETDGKETLTVSQQAGGMQVYGCTANFVFEGDTLRSISGKRLIGVPQENGVLQDTMSPTTAVFLCVQQKAKGDIYTKIISVEAGYQAAASLTEPWELNPIWQIVTDTGTYLVNASLGTIERENV